MNTLSVGDFLLRPKLLGVTHVGVWMGGGAVRYGVAQAGNGLSFDPVTTRLVDCYSKKVVEGDRLSKVRDTQLDSALKEIRRMWPSIPSN